MRESHRPSRTLATTVVLALAALGLPGVAHAQVSTGSISGTVTDTLGAVVPGATVTITHTELRAARVITTDGAGRYVAVELRPGTYDIKVESPGFQTAFRRGVVLSVRDVLAIDFTMNPGAVTEVVEVTGEVPLLETQSADAGSVVERRRIVDLPLDGRRYSDLITLSPGAIPAPGTGNTREARINVDGNFSLQNYFSLSGVDNNSFSTNAQERSPQVIQPPPDAIREFKIQTRTYSAEFGWMQGAVINADLQSGSNDFHGSAWWFHRNDNLDATGFFANAAELEKGEFLRNHFGYTIGGPIVPNKTFFFHDLQYTKNRKQVTMTGTVPTAEMRAGDFSIDRAGIIQDPSTYIPEEAGCVTGDQINLTALRTDGRPCGDPVALALVELYPLPNAPGISPFTYASTPNRISKMPSFDVRIDHSFGGGSDTLYGSYSFYQENRDDEPGPLPNVLAPGSWPGNGHIRGQLVGITWNHLFSPTLINDLRGGFNRIWSSAEGLAPFGSVASDFGLTGAPDNPYVMGLPSISAGFSRIGTPPWRPQWQVSQVYQAIDNVSYIRGSHQFKFGFEYKRLINNFLDVAYLGGGISFGGRGFWANDTYANFLLGNVSGQQNTTAHVVHNYIDGFMFFGQDQWQVAPNFTLTYGMRYEYFTPFLERNNQLSNFDLTANGGAGAMVTPSSNISYDPSGPVLAAPAGWGKGLVKPDRNNIAPRLGFAWTPIERLSLRGGFGVFYQVMDRIGSESILALNPPHLIDVRISTESDGPPLYFLRDGMLPEPTTVDLRALMLRIRDRNEVAPYSLQWSFGPQFQLTNDIALDVSYVGQATHKVRRLWNLNQGRIVTMGIGPVEAPFPDFCFSVTPYSCAHIEILSSEANTNYHSLQVQAKKRFSHGLTFNLAYTWGKGLGNAGDNLSAGLSGSSLVRPQYAWNRGKAEYGRLVFDQRHRLVFNWVYELPFGPGKTWLNEGPAAKILGDWRFNGIWSSTSGPPVGITASDRSFTGSGHNYRADCVGDWKPSGFDQNIEHWFDTTAFAQPANYTFGSCGPNIISAQSVHNMDMSLFKNVQIDEARRLEFRFEFFNAFNTPAFAGPDTSITSTTFGQTLSLRNPEREAREIQLGVKFVF